MKTTATVLRSSDTVSEGDAAEAFRGVNAFPNPVDYSQTEQQGTLIPARGPAAEDEADFLEF